MGWEGVAGHRTISLHWKWKHGLTEHHGTDGTPAIPPIDGAATDRGARPETGHKEAVSNRDGFERAESRTECRSASKTPQGQRTRASSIFGNNRVRRKLSARRTAGRYSECSPQRTAVDSPSLSGSIFVGDSPIDPQCKKKQRRCQQRLWRTAGSMEHPECQQIDILKTAPLALSLSVTANAAIWEEIGCPMDECEGEMKCSERLSTFRWHRPTLFCCATAGTRRFWGRWSQETALEHAARPQPVERWRHSILGRRTQETPTGLDTVEMAVSDRAYIGMALEGYSAIQIARG